jgi:hypothetical protein
MRSVPSSNWSFYGIFGSFSALEENGDVSCKLVVLSEKLPVELESVESPVHALT